MTTFNTIQDALDAGYTRPTSRDRDVSGPNYHGYDFERGGQTTVSVWLTEEQNALGRPGAFQPMFPPLPKS